MDKQQAQDIVKDALQNPFNRERFVYFIKNLLNKIDESKAFHARGYVPEIFKDHVKTYERIGTYTDPEDKKTDIIIVYLQKETALDRARTTQRNFIARYLKDRGEKESGLIAFVSPDEEDWRFSLVKMDYRFEEGKGGRVKIKEEFTPARRWSFLVGKNENCHTAQSKLYPIIADDKNNPTLAELEEAFNIEKVTKEFYTAIAKKFTELVGGERKIGSKKMVEKGCLRLPSTDNDTIEKEFAVRLIGRLLFCWFLKKKKSEKDVPLLDNIIISSRAVQQVTGYYHNMLERLFFQVLNTPHNKRIKEANHDPWPKVPFLNGGLFEPHRHDYYEIDALNHSKHLNTLIVPDEWLKELFKIFELYNFTIDESTTIDVDISVDPEMLGRIFENLLAEINPDTGETARKSTGSYYTPRPIVEYMVDESLKQYLLTQVSASADVIPVKTGIQKEKGLDSCLRRNDDNGIETKISRLLSYAESDIDLSEEEKDLIIDALDRVKIIDPACGSGAFPMGILHKMLLILQKIDPESKKWLSKKLPRIDNKLLRHEVEAELKKKNWDYIHKLGIIQYSIYGVDIQPIAVEISKLRFFLSLIVDEKIDDSKPNRGVVPLPNLEFKFVSANSLIGLPKIKKEQDIGLGESQHDINRLKELRDAYFTASGGEKRKIEKDFRETQHKMFLHSLSWSTDSQTYKLSEWNPFADEAASWFDPEWMFGIKSPSHLAGEGTGDGGFDIVIANPPYLRIQIIKESAATEARYFKENYIAAKKGNYDIYVVFLELGLRLLNKIGEFAFILPHKFFNAQYGQPIRELLSKGKHVSQIVHFGEHQIFQGATNYTCLLFLKKSGIDYCRFLKVDDLENWFKTQQGSEGIISASQITAADWNFVIGKDSSLFEKLNKMPVKLGDIADIFVGLQTSADDVFIMDLIEDTPKTFRLRSKSLDTEWSFEKELLFPIVSGTDVNRYAPLPSRQYILFPYKVNDDSATLIDFKTITDKYPRTASYLKENKKRLEEREHDKMRGPSWYGYIYRKNMTKQSIEKLCVPRLIEKLYAAYDIDGSHYLDNVDVGGITLKESCQMQEIRYLLALLNSKLLQWYFPFVSAPFRGGWLSANRQFLSLLPIRFIDYSNKREHTLHENILQMVDQILAAKQQPPSPPFPKGELHNADTSVLEKQIDEMVYALYGLTPDEIAIVEGKK